MQPPPPPNQPPPPPPNEPPPPPPNEPPPPPSLLRRATTKAATVLVGPDLAEAMTSAPQGLMRKASSVLLDLGGAIMPNVEIGVDVLGLVAPPPPNAPAPPARSTSVESAFEEDDLFTVDVDAEGELTPMVVSVDLTSPVLREESGEPLDWAAELLLLTHEPLRRDMLEMQRALQPKFFGELPEGWRVRAFFRFFGAWCSLVSQQHAVEIAVHYDWLAAPTRKLDDAHRSELLSYHQRIELELLAVSRMERKILDELSQAADWTTSDPWSEGAEVLRSRLAKLCSEIRVHLATQESVLPELLRGHWGRISPPQIVTRSLEAAKRAQGVGTSVATVHESKLLLWVHHYLHRRSPDRAKALIGSLPFVRRMSFAFGRGTPHTKILAHLRCIINDHDPHVDDPPPGSVQARHTSARSDGDDDADDGTGGATSGAGETATERERRAGMVSSVLAAANARRVDVPLNQASVHRTLADHEDPLHTFKMDGNWVNKNNKIPDNLFKKIGMEKDPEPPRRL